MEIVLPIVISVLLVLVSSIGLFFVCFKGGSKGRTVCLLGLSNSGKTLLYMRLVQNEFVRTQTSMKENRTSLRLTNKRNKQVTVDLVDIPGNERLRDRTWRQHTDSLLAVVLVVDSVNFPQEVRDIAHLTISVLSDPLVQRRRVPVLVTCNKQDVVLAVSQEDIKTRLEAEITQILTNPSVQLDSTDQSREVQQTKLLLSEEDGNKFTFEMQKVHTGFISCSARGTGDEGSCEAQVEGLREWLATVS